jgi:hypothetical protein
MKRTLPIISGGLLSLTCTLIIHVGATAQVDPKQVLAGMIHQLQTGTPNPSWYGIELWQIIAIQTGNTGYYQPLAQLGPAQNIGVVQQLQLPVGSLYAMTVQHQHGQSAWILGLSSMSNRIEYAYFEVGQHAQQSPFPLPTPAPYPPADSRTSPTPPNDTSDACKKFPNLC